MNGVALGDLAEFINGAAFKPADWGDEGRRIIRIQNLTDSAKPYNRTTRLVPTKYEVPKGTLLVSWSASLGVFEWQEPDTALLNQHIFKVVPNRRADQGYLRHMLAKALVDMERYAHGSTMLHVNRNEFLGTTIPLPTLDEQRRIAAILDEADEVRRLRQRSRRKTQDIRSSIFEAHFPSVASAEHTVPLEELADIQVGHPFESANFTDDLSGIRLCRGANVLPGRLDWSDLARWPAKGRKAYTHLELSAGDVVIAMDRPWISEGFKITQVKESDLPALLVQRVARLRADDNAMNLFLYHLLLRPKFARHCKPTETTIPHISPKEIRNFAVVAPPMEALSRFANEMNLVNDYEHQQLMQLGKLELLFASLQHRAFRGEL